MRRNFIIIASVMMLVVLSGCGNKETIVGDWELSEFCFYDENDGKRIYIYSTDKVEGLENYWDKYSDFDFRAQFTDDGKCAFSANGIETTGIWENSASTDDYVDKAYIIKESDFSSDGIKVVTLKKDKKRLYIYFDKYDDSAAIVLKRR